MLEHLYVKFGDPCFVGFYPLNAMPVPYMLSSCVRPSVSLSVCPSVCHKSVKTAKPRTMQTTITIAQGL